MSKCSICTAEIDNTTAPILTMGAHVRPKCICEDCASDIETVNTSREYLEISAAFDRISDKLAANPVSDSSVNDAVTNILNFAAERAERIKDGTYDFSVDDALASEELEEIPEELLETDEDKAKDERDELAAKRLDKIMNFVYAAIFVGVLVFALIKLF